MSRKTITPDMRVGELLADFPELEDVLISLSPAFKKLKNPILRKTVGKVATLRQVAQVGNISVGELISALRKAAGLSELDITDEADGSESSDRPDWFDKSRIIESFDACPLIEAGGQPMGQVTGAWKKLEKGDIYELITPFPPAPLIDMAKDQGVDVWSLDEEPELTRTWFCRPG
ncbi:MAG: DUF1858 domain-containing protein [FCB group bacterium]|nr:DUF1858 domain-containing protein [FCB group bacterium]